MRLQPARKNAGKDALHADAVVLLRHAHDRRELSLRTQQQQFDIAALLSLAHVFDVVAEGVEGSLPKQRTRIELEQVADMTGFLRACHHSQPRADRAQLAAQQRHRFQRGIDTFRGEQPYQYQDALAGDFFAQQHIDRHIAVDERVAVGFQHDDAFRRGAKIVEHLLGDKEFARRESRLAFLVENAESFLGGASFFFARESEEGHVFVQHPLQEIDGFLSFQCGIGARIGGEVAGKTLLQLLGVAVDGFAHALPILDGGAVACADAFDIGLNFLLSRIAVVAVALDKHGGEVVVALFARQRCLRRDDSFEEVARGDDGDEALY